MGDGGPDVAEGTTMFDMCLAMYGSETPYIMIEVSPNYDAMVAYLRILLMVCVFNQIGIMPMFGIGQAGRGGWIGRSILRHG
jgi:hypothetical protein